MLSGGKAFQSPIVRKYAVDVLGNASDEELQIFLLQLVQALRYEPVGSTIDNEDTAASSILVRRMPGSDSVGHAASNLPNSPQEEIDEKEDYSYPLEALSPLGQFLVLRACSSATGGLFFLVKLATFIHMFYYPHVLLVANFFYWCTPDL